MNNSHESCDLDYDCSCYELNEVVKEAKKCGCFCARLTGAGMGGYAVGLLHS